MAQTSLLLHPTIEECRKAAVAEGMPEREGDKFFHFYNSKGWKIGKETMKSFSSAVSGWRLRWEEGKSKNGQSGMTDAQLIFKQKEYERILARLKVIYNSYDAHNDLRPGDRTEVGRLKQRASELKKELGITI